MTPFVHRWGGGGTLLIHCALAHGAVLARLAGELGGATAFDLPGHGKSPPWDDARDYHAQAVEWAASLLEAPGPVLGHSFGGTVALRLAVERTDLVTRLILVEPVYFAALRIHDAPSYSAYEESFSDIAAAYERGDSHKMAELFTAMWGGAPWGSLPGRFKDAVAAQMPLIIAQGQGIDADSGDVFAPGRLEALDCPVTLIRGSETQASVAAIHRVLLDRLTNASEHVIAGADHMAPMTHPHEVARLSQL